MLLILLLISVVLIVLSTAKWHVHPFLALIAAALFFGLFSGMPLDQIVASINEGFGGTLKSVGLVIIFGVIIGSILEHTGAAYTLADFVLRVIGRKRVPLGMSLIGYIVSIPVFADSGFVLLSPLNKALTRRAGLSLATTAVALSIGLMATHTLVPPTPGPVAAAGIIGADLGMVILWGLVASLLGLIPALIFAIKVASKTKIDPEPGLSDLELDAKLKEGPGLFGSSIPLLLPILLIILKSYQEYSGIFTNETVVNIVNFIGSPVIALFCGLIIALLIPKKLDEKVFSEKGWVGGALRSAAIIIMITGAGGVFGKVLQNSGLGNVIGGTMQDYNIGIWLPFLIAAALKTAQGSSTVAIITTVSIVTPLLGALGLDSEMSKVFVVLATGAGAAVVSHANDSYFWIVTQMSGMDVSTGYRLQSVATGIYGLSAGLVIFILWLLIA